MLICTYFYINTVVYLVGNYWRLYIIQHVPQYTAHSNARNISWTKLSVLSIYCLNSLWNSDDYCYFQLQTNQINFLFFKYGVSYHVIFNLYLHIKLQRTSNVYQIYHVSIINIESVYVSKVKEFSSTYYRKKHIALVTRSFRYLLCRFRIDLSCSGI